MPSRRKHKAVAWVKNKGRQKTTQAHKPDYKPTLHRGGKCNRNLGRGKTHVSSCEKDHRRMMGSEVQSNWGLELKGERKKEQEQDVSISSQPGEFSGERSDRMERWKIGIDRISVDGLLESMGQGAPFSQ